MDKDFADIRLAILTNIITPYRLPFFEEIQRRIPHLKIYISSPMEPNRPWSPEWGNLDVEVQKTIKFTSVWKHPMGFEETIYRHLPLSTYFDLHNFQPDVIISGEAGFRSISAYFYQLLHTQTRFFIWLTTSAHTEVRRSMLQKKIRMFLLRHADAVFVQGKSGADYVKQFGINDEKIGYLPNVIDMNPFASLPVKESYSTNRINLITIGQLVARKGLLPFIQCLSDWAERNPDKKFFYRIIGNGPLMNELRSQSLPKNIQMQFIGNLPYSALPEQYAWADWFVFPTLADGWGVVVNESLASGVPVIGSLYAQAVEELVIPGENGFAFFPDRPAEIFACLDKAFSLSPDGKTKMNENCRKQIKNLNAVKVADELLDIIKRS